MKTCFVIMPFSDGTYDEGHFRRVYEHIIEPACEMTGFKPIRGDDVKHTNLIAIDIIRKLIDSDMAICDLSSKNPNVLYELGIRQAFNKPVTLIRDGKTERIFDIQGFRDIQYNESLRIDTVKQAIAELAETMKNTYYNHDTETNSLVSLLGIGAAKLGTLELPQLEMMLGEISGFAGKMASMEKSLFVQSQQSQGKNTTGANVATQGINNIEAKADLSADGLSVGDEILHVVHGPGKIVSMGTGDFPTMLVDFEQVGKKPLIKGPFVKKVTPAK